MNSLQPTKQSKISALKWLSFEENLYYDRKKEVSSFKVKFNNTNVVNFIHRRHLIDETEFNSNFSYDPPYNHEDAQPEVVFTLNKIEEIALLARDESTVTDGKRDFPKLFNERFLDYVKQLYSDD